MLDLRGQRAREVARGAIERGAAQKERELAALLRLLRRRRLYTVVEIGTLSGGTLWAWCQVAEPDGLLVSIDLPGGLFGGGYEENEVPRLRSYARPHQELHLLPVDSHDPRTLETVRTLLRDRPIDLLFIDGDHTYEGVRRDFCMYGPLVRRNGLIVLHDVVPHPDVPECQVDRLWNAVKGDYKHVALVDPGDVRGWGQWGGIGVLYAGVPAGRAAHLRRRLVSARPMTQKRSRS